MTAPATDPLGWVGATVDGKYRVDELVGEGGFGVVYRAHHLGFGERVAFKALRVPTELEGEEKERFFASFLAEGRLQHQLSRATAGIVQALDVAAATSPTGIWTPYLVLEWLEGRTLEAEMDERWQLGLGGRPLVEAVTLLDPVARALEVAHERGVAHRDVKPANLFITDVGGRKTLKVLDFGIAKVLTESESVSKAYEATGRSLQAFTAHYGAPEQFARRFGATGPWSDVFSLALVLVELVSGKRALEGDDAAALFVCAADTQLRPTLRAREVECSDALEAVLLKALAVDPKERYKSAGELWDAVLGAAGLAGRAPLSSAHAAAIPPEVAVGSLFSVSTITPAQPPPAKGRPTPETRSGDQGKTAADSPSSKHPDGSTQLSSTSQLPAESTAQVPVSPARASGTRLLLAVASASLVLGAVAGGTGYLLRRQAQKATAALGSGALSAVPRSSLARSARPAAPASAAPPLASGAGSASAAPPVSAQPPATIAAGFAIGTNIWLDEFRMQRLPDDTDRTLLEAQTRCADAGLSLCSEQQWVRACTDKPELAPHASWTLTGTVHGFVVRGGGACSTRSVAQASQSSPDVGAICCDRGVAVESANANKTFLSATAQRLETVEAALNSRRSSAFTALIQDGVVLEGEARSLADVGKLLDESFSQYPDQWSILDTCTVSVKPRPPAAQPKRRKWQPKRQRRPESASWSAQCEQLRQRSGDFSIVTALYVFGGNGKLQSIEELRTSRAWAKP